MTPQNLISLEKGRLHTTIAIIGSGPRGLAAFERLAYYINTGATPSNIKIILIDDTEIAAGRIWRTNQRQNLLMNTLATQMTLFSGDRDEAEARPGAGPSLNEWLEENKGKDFGYGVFNDYATRGLYGHYMKFVFNAVVDSLPAETKVETLCASVNSMNLQDGVYTLGLVDGNTIEGVDKVLVATGHPRSNPAAWESRLKDFAHDRENCLYMQGDSAADMDLDSIKDRENVALIGMGLGFYDIAISLTQDRGGRFVECDGELSYVPSGREPHIIAGSRSGVPLLSRGINQKERGHQYTPRYFTREAVDQLRLKAQQANGSRQLDFDQDILPLFDAELQHAYFKTHVARDKGKAEAEVFSKKFDASLGFDHDDNQRLLKQFGLQDVEPMDIFTLARPFHDKTFASLEEYQKALLEMLHWDLAETQKGNCFGPIKAALDTIRDLRDHIRYVVDFEGLTTDTYRSQFLKSFLPVISFLSAGPPAVRVKQVIALMNAGVLEVVGPNSDFATDEENNCFIISSAQVKGSEIKVSQLVDTRVPVQNMAQDRSALMKDMLQKGLIRSHVVKDSQGNRFASGGVEVTAQSYQAVGVNGTVTEGLYLLGIPSEHVRWFTQVGSGTVGVFSTFTKDADKSARALLSLDVAAQGQNELLDEAS